MESPTVESVVVRLITDKPVQKTPYQVKGVFMKQFSDETQFIIVTHNKLTMEIANHMYGVTQEKKGVSKLVSVSFD